MCEIVAWQCVEDGEVTESLMIAEHWEYHGYTVNPLTRKMFSGHCMCPTCKDGDIHASDCAVHNMPAYPNEKCDCTTAFH